MTHLVRKASDMVGKKSVGEFIGVILRCEDVLLKRIVVLFLVDDMCVVLRYL